MEALRFPKILQLGKVSELNRNALIKTGCFFFLNTEELPAPQPKTWQDAFLSNVVALYALYHDYGRKFLDLVLQCEDLLPPNSSVFIKKRQKRAFQHKMNICKTFRANFCHGTYPHHSNARSKVARQLNIYSGLSSKTSMNWNDIKNFSEDEWKSISIKIVTEADELYDFLNEWVGEWAKVGVEEQRRLLDNFLELGYDKVQKKWVKSSEIQSAFIRGFDKGLCIPIIETVRSEIQERGLSEKIVYSNDAIYEKGVSENGGIDVWISTLRDALLTRSINEPEEVYFKLKSSIENTMLDRQPGTIRRSSTSIAKQTGYEL